MAAEIALITFVLKPLIEGAISKVGSFAADPIIMACCWKKELASLQKSLTTVQGVLQDAEGRQEADQAIKDWLRDLQDVAYDAEDVLDEYAYHNLQCKVETGVQKLIQVCTSPFFYLEMASKIKEINERLGDLITRSNLLKLMPDSTIHTSQSAHKITESLHDTTKVVGRNDDVSKIVNWLTNLRNQHHLSAISIIGMAGVGKTTLARSLYKKAKEEDLYDAVAWVCVSDEFDEKKILTEMLEHFNRGGGDRKSMNVLVEDLADNLKNKTYLLILDDVWNKDAYKWNSFCSRLSKIVSTASIVITTRSEEVASIIGNEENELPTHMHLLQRLSVDQCWSIIEEKVPESRRPIPPELQLIGRAIAEKCGGLPLVAAVIGGPLSKRINNEAWLKIKDSNAWDSLYENKILPVLKISFDHLRAPLKKCFSYCSIFPKDSAMGKGDLIQLWMAQGFLGQSNDMEEIGNQYFDELLSNSLFQDVVIHDQLGHIVSCKMHDVVHDLALSISQGEILIWEAGCSIDENSGIRHLRVKFDGQGPLQNIPRGVAQRLHSLCCDVSVFNRIAFDWRSLRSLKLLGTASTELPSSLGKLKHLKYLDITESNSNVLPKSFSKLYCLQTLRLCKSRFHRNVEEFPDSLTKLICLRHICYRCHLAWNPILQNLPRGIGRLTSLKTLGERFSVGNEKGYKIEELGCLRKLEGELQIEKLEQVGSQLEASEAKLKEKTKLYALRLSWTRRSPRDALCREGDYNKVEEVLDALQPHSDLKSLTINSYPGEKFPWWIAGSVNGSGSPSWLNNLVELTLGYCSECTLFPDLGRLPNLQHLEISGMSKVSNLRRSDNQEGVDSITLYPALKTLHIRDMESLEEGFEVHEEVKGVVVLPCLELLSIFECPGLKIWNQSRSTQLSKVQMGNCRNLTAITFMDGLTSLKKLNLVNCHKLTCLPSRRGSYISLTTLTILKIQSCQKLNIPEEWLGRLTSLTELLIGTIGGFCSKLTLDNSSECTLFPVLGLLPNLQHLKIYGMSKVRSMSHKFNLRRSDNQDGVDSITLYPALKKLEIMHMDSLEEGVEVHEEVGVVVLPCLEYLSITNCPRLKTWNQSRFTQLSRVYIRDCPNLAAIPFMEGLTSLKSLELMNCDELTCLLNRMGSYTSLPSLSIKNCKKLSIPEDYLGRLTSLQSLSITGFWSELEEFPGLNRTLPLSLEYLELWGWEELKSLPHQLQHLTALKSLCIRAFHGLEALPEWIGNLSSLQDLVIWRCHNLTSLPSVEAMRQLSNLKRLSIQECPKLKERCAKEIGPEWSKISHIPGTCFLSELEETT